MFRGVLRGVEALSGLAPRIGSFLLWAFYGAWRHFLASRHAFLLYASLGFAWRGGIWWPRATYWEFPLMGFLRGVGALSGPAPRIGSFLL